VCPTMSGFAKLMRTWSYLPAVREKREERYMSVCCKVCCKGGSSELR
jgi:hypothetical protein